jgi:hypothetical protein
MRNARHSDEKAFEEIRLPEAKRRGRILGRLSFDELL